MDLQLPKNVTYQKLYQINDQNIWFLAWILEQVGSCSHFNEQILSQPFSTKRYFYPKWSYQKQREFTLKNGKKHGIDYVWRRNRQLMKKTHWKDGKLHGQTLKWYMNFKKYKKYSYVDGGQLSEESNWQDGQEHGIFRRWWRNGHLSDEFNLQNGKQDGFYRQWNTNGVLVRESFRVNSIKKYERCWADNGKLCRLLYWKNGRIIKHSIVVNKMFSNHRKIFLINSNHPSVFCNQ